MKSPYEAREWALPGLSERVVNKVIKKKGAPDKWSQNDTTPTPQNVVPQDQLGSIGAGAGHGSRQPKDDFVLKERMPASIPCTNCRRRMLLQKNGVYYCPTCGYTRR